MAIIVQWRASVDSYAEPGKKVRVRRPSSCPSCLGLHLIFWSGYFRFVTTPDGERKISIRRVLCKGCGKTHSLLPWFLLPHRHHAVHVIGHALWLKTMKGLSRRETSRRTGIPLSTVRGWVSRFSQCAQHHYGRALFLIHASGANAPPLPPCNYREGCLLAFQMLFSVTSLKGDPHLFWPYVSLLTEGCLLRQQKPASRPGCLAEID